MDPPDPPSPRVRRTRTGAARRVTPRVHHDGAPAQPVVACGPVGGRTRFSRGSLATCLGQAGWRAGDTDVTCASDAGLPEPTCRPCVFEARPRARQGFMDDPRRLPDTRARCPTCSQTRLCFTWNSMRLGAGPQRGDYGAGPGHGLRWSAAQNWSWARPLEPRGWFHVEPAQPVRGARSRMVWPRSHLGTRIQRAITNPSRQSVLVMALERVGGAHLPQPHGPTPVVRRAPPCHATPRHARADTRDRYAPRAHRLAKREHRVTAKDQARPPPPARNSIELTSDTTTDGSRDPPCAAPVLCVLANPFCPALTRRCST